MAGETEHSPGTAVLRSDTTAAELEKLALSEDQGVRAAVAAHPNTPADVLGVLAPDFPGEVLGNSALALLRLAHPGLLQGWPRDTVLTLISHELAPEWLRRYARRHQKNEYQVALASNSALNAAEVAALACHPFWQVRAKIAARPDLPPDLLTLLTDDPDYGVRLYMAARTDLPPENAEVLRRDPSLFVRQVLEQTQKAALAAFLLMLCFSLPPWIQAG